MTAGTGPHATTIELAAPAPLEVAVGADFVLAVKVSCAAGCDLVAIPLEVTTPDGVVVASACHTGPGRAGAVDIALEAPRQPGEHIWTVRSGPHYCAGIRHEEASLTVRIDAVPQATSLAVWAVPSPVVMGQSFTIRVGAKSSAAMALAGGKIEVRDESDAVVARGCLGETPLPETSALYWTEIELPAPPREGMHAWSVTLEPGELALAHERAVTTFSASIVGPPEHRLTITVIEQDTAAPIADAQVRLSAFRAATDPSGLAVVDLPSGVYELSVWKVGYEAPARTITVNENMSVAVAVVSVPEEDPDAAWLM
jgi:hypothetical protein